MKGRLLPLFAFALLLAPLAPAHGAPERVPLLVTQAKALIQAKDYMGFRILVKKAYSRKMTYGEWYGLKNLVNIQSINAGFDLVQLWSARNPPAKSIFDTNLEKSDQLMLAGKFQEAFIQYQANALYLKKLKGYLASRRGPGIRDRYEDVKTLYLFVLHSMGRALYGSGRYEDALKVYSWIDPSYPQYRQVMFEKMWAGFRAGKVEVALGAIASQRSNYFSKYLSPESYLIQTYIYRKLCRIEELDQILLEMKAYESSLKSGNFADWARADTEGLVLMRLTSAPDPSDNFFGVTLADREAERAEIKRALMQGFERQRPRILEDLKTAMAYVNLINVSDSGAVLKPVREFKSRQELLAQDLEFWPADSSEEWADEVGTHIFLGDSLCAKTPH